MPNVRKPKPRPEPTTLRELVLDIDHRLEGGDALSDVWLPHEDWTRLVEQAFDEHPETSASNPPGFPDGSVPSQTFDRVVSANAALQRQVDDLSYQLECIQMTRAELLAEKTGGPISSFLPPDHRARAELVKREAASPTGADQDAEPEHPECPTCGEADGHKPADCVMAEKPKKKRAPKKAKPDAAPAAEPEARMRPHRMKIHNEPAADEADQVEAPF